MYTEARLGQVWQILTPLLNVAVYYLIFGLILNTKRGVPDFIAFLVIGVFIFNFTQRSFIISSRVMWDSLPLIRALYFPRACLPLGYVLIELQQLVISLIVIFATVLAVGQPFTWYWLLIIPILVMQTLFNVGAGFTLARFGAGFDDVSQLLPFIVRTWFYASGVMFSIQTFSNLAHHPTIARILQYNPAAIYITLTRLALLKSQRQSMPGAQPFNQRLCTLYYHPQAHASQSFLNANLLNSSPLPCGGERVQPVAVRRGAGGGRPGRRVHLLLAGGGAVRPWLTRWWSWTTCTWCTGCTAPGGDRGTAATALMRMMRRQRRPWCARCTRSGASPSSPTGAMPWA